MSNKPRPEDFVGKLHQNKESLSELQQARVVIGAAFISRTDEYIIVGDNTSKKRVRTDLRETVDNILVELLKNDEGKNKCDPYEK